MFQLSFLAINGNIKFLENMKQGFKRKFSWTKYKSETTTEPKNNNLAYVIHSTCQSFRNLQF